MKTILVADDWEDEVTGLIEELRQTYIVEYVSDGKQAIERIEQGGLDGAVLDWNMPPKRMNKSESGQFDGDSVAKRARALYPDLALVLSSTIAEAFVTELRPYNVLCHSKYGSNQPILDYFQKKLRE